MQLRDFYQTALYSIRNQQSVSLSIATMDAKDHMRKFLRGDLPPDPMGDKLQTVKAENQIPRTRTEKIKRHLEAVKQLENNHGITWCKSTSDSVRKQECPFESVRVPGIATLTPILISELKPQREPYKGRVLFCKVVTPSYKIESVMTLVDDETGEIANLAIYNHRKAKQELNVGRQLAIIEPFSKTRHDGSNGIRVDNPNEIVYDVDPTVYKNSTAAASDTPTARLAEKADRSGSKDEEPTEKSTSDPHVSTTVELPSKGNLAAFRLPEKRPKLQRVVTSKSVLDQKQKGDASFKARRYEEAEACYSSAIKLAQKKSFDQESQQNTGDGVGMWVLHSNRAMTRLKKGKPDLALKDAQDSYRCSPAGISKPLVRYAQALDTLGCRPEALEVLKAKSCEIVKEEQTLLIDMQKKLESMAILRVGPLQKYKTISGAVAAAPPNAEILVDAGLYRESLVLEKPVIIRSTAPTPKHLVPPDVVGGVDWAEIRMSSFHPVCVHLGVTREESVRLIGFRIVSERDKVGIFSPFLGMRGHGALVKRGTAIFLHCSITSAGGPVVCSDQSESRTILEHCSVHDGAEGGILANDSAVIVLKQVQVCYNAANGLELRTGGSAFLKDCQLFANGRQSILIWNQAGSMKAKSCDIHSNKTESGVMVRENNPAKASFEDCVFRSNGMAGVVVEDQGSAFIEKCLITDNYEGVLIQGSGSAEVKECNVNQNKSNGIFVGFDHISGYVKLINNEVKKNQFKGILLGTGQNERYFLKDNVEKGNRGMPLPIPAELLQLQQASGGHQSLRKWAKRVMKCPPVSGATTDSSTLGTADPLASLVARVIRDTTPTLAEMILACGFCEQTAPEGVKFLKCARCLSVCYCSAECQKRHWGSHKKKCTPVKPKHPSFADPYMSV